MPQIVYHRIIKNHNKRIGGFELAYFGGSDFVNKSNETFFVGFKYFIDLHDLLKIISHF